MRKLNRKSISTLAAAATLIAFGSAGAASLHKTVTLQVDGQSKTVSGFLVGSVASLVQKQGIQLSDQDVVLPGKDAAVSDGMSIVVTHARQVLIKDGNNPSKELATTAATVADLLKQANIQLGEHDKINTDLQSPPTEGQTIQITRRDVKVSVADEKIPFQTERQPDPDMYTGQEKVLTRGVEGLAKITTTVVTENGVEVDRQQNRQVVQEPVSGVVSFGTKNRPIVPVFCQRQRQPVIDNCLSCAPPDRFRFLQIRTLLFWLDPNPYRLLPDKQ